MKLLYLLSRDSLIRQGGRLFGLAVLSTQVLFASPVSATEPLGTFLEGARANGFDAREQAATIRQRDWEAQAALGRLLPSFAARGTVTHNQYGAELPPGTFPGQTDAITITPQNQFDATFQVNVPLIDASQHARFQQAKHFAKASEAQRDVVYTDLDRAVAQAYYTYVGAAALVHAAEGSLALAQQNFDFVANRASLGAATELEQEQARANVERAKRDLVDARLIGINASRNLETLTGLTPTPPEAYPVDDLRHEAPLEQWMSAQDTPADRVQKELTKAARSAKRASAYALLPTLSANATERISNATGFVGQAASYAIQGVLSWNLDYGTYSTAQAQVAAADVQKIRAERTRRGVEDNIFDAYHRVEASIARSESARSEAQASKKAALLSMERYQAGSLTQLDVTQSQREAFQAQAARIKSDADLALARVLLRVSAGQPAEVPQSREADLVLEQNPPLPQAEDRDTEDSTKDPEGSTP